MVWFAALFVALAVPNANVTATDVLAPEQSIHRVPEDFPTIQDAVNAASSSDQIRVGPGQWCGATITKQLDLRGEGSATLIGCSTGPSISGTLRIGFFLPDSGASGTTIRHFVFDGRGISTANFDPLSFAVFARGASNVVVEQNRILGTVQGITNTAGSGWAVAHNVIEGLTLFDCNAGPCGGGVGIVFQDRNLAGPRQTDNVAVFNVIDGAEPPNFDIFTMAGILILGGQDGATVQANRITIPNGEAIEVSDACCGSPAGFITAINSVIVKNDGRGSEFAIVITLDAGGGMGNTEGTVLRGNFGTNSINNVSSVVTNRSSKTLIEFQ
jgi:hypothetical protein